MIAQLEACEKQVADLSGHLCDADKKIATLVDALGYALDRMEGENARSEYGFEEAILRGRAALKSAQEAA